MKILLIEDDPQIAKSLETLLKKFFNADVTTINSIQEAVELLENPESPLERPAVIVCDYHGSSSSLLSFLLGFCKDLPITFVLDNPADMVGLSKVGALHLLASVDRKSLNKELVERISGLIAKTTTTTTATPQTPQSPEAQAINERVSEIDRVLGLPDAKPEELQALAGSSLDVITDLSTKLGFTPLVQHLALKCVELTLKAIGNKPRLSLIIQNLKKNEHRYLSSHSIMLAEICCAMATKIGWNTAPVFLKLTLAAYIHDLAIQKDELAKCKTLKEAATIAIDSADLKAYKFHPLRGAEYARKFHEIPADVDTIIVQHHELPDGQGFPRGLFHSQLSPMSCLFIISEDMLHFFLEKNGSTFDEFIQANGHRYNAGHFKKILKLMTTTVAE